MDLDEIIKLAIKFASDQCGEQVIIIASLFPDQARGAHLDGWALFIVMPESRAGEFIHVGVHTETRETKIVDTEDE
jgi:hypothetical protein